MNEQVLINFNQCYQTFMKLSYLHGKLFFFIFYKFKIVKNVALMISHFLLIPLVIISSLKSNYATLLKTVNFDTEFKN